MALKHSNPTRPRIDRDQRRFLAFAPYNFVPLPEKIVSARKPIDQDSYAEGLTGWIDCELKTCSPTYIRGMLSEAEYKKFGKARAEDLTPDQKIRNALFFATSEEQVEGYPVPVVPGSTLRGMIRTLVEIVGYCRMRWVGNKPTFTFRAVAAAKDDPLQAPYQDALGRFGNKVQAGYLEKKGDEWFVRPALSPKSQNLPDRGHFLRVRERKIEGKDIPGYLPFNSPDYRPQWYPVSFSIDIRKGRQGRFSFIDRIGSRGEDYPHRGVLVCSGNMQETAKSNQKSPRSHHTLIFPLDENAQPIRIPTETVCDYLDGLTDFQREKLGDWGGEYGCLKNGAPVFFVRKENQVSYFGHSPNFRIPVKLANAGNNRAARPTDFIPAAVCKGPHDDLADVIFGWVDEADEGSKDQRAGRVFFGDAHFIDAENGVWVSPKPITPRPLSSPKPTTFQHYLVQDKSAGHDPDNKKSLAHYGSPPTETQIRGHKLYWHKGSDPSIEATLKEREATKQPQGETQVTRIIPLKAGVRFSFRIRFENLREEELGALWWSLFLPGEPGVVYRHKLGMGKPLGMGAVALSPRLYLSDRPDRYAFLFKSGEWHEAVSEAQAARYLEAFEKYLLKECGIGPDKNRLFEVERIQMLLAMLQWSENGPDWQDRTRYLEIEHGDKKINEYKERPVLPDPIETARSYFKKLDKEPLHTSGPLRVSS